MWIKPRDYNPTFIISSRAPVAAHWWTMTSVFGRHGQKDRFTWVEMERKKRGKEDRTRSERTGESRAVL